MCNDKDKDKDKDTVTKEEKEKIERNKDKVQSKIVEIWENIHKVILDHELISSQFSMVLKMIKNSFASTDLDMYRRHYIQILFAMTLYIRDIGYGLGLRELTYDLLFVWYQIYPVLAVSALRLIVCSSYGSWRDIPGLCQRLLIQFGSSSSGVGSNFSHTAIELMNQQLRSDWIEFTQTGYCKTNVCKWIPRECCRNSWLFCRMAAEWWGVSVARLTGFHKKEYRRVFSTLSRAIDVVEIKQCARQWAEIIPENLGIGALNKYRRCFLRGSGGDEDPYSRAICAKKFAGGVCHKPRTNTIFAKFKYFMPKRLYCDLSTHVSDAIQCIKGDGGGDGGHVGDLDGWSELSVNSRWNNCVDTYRMKNYGMGDFLPIICYNGQIIDKAFLNILGHAYLISCHSRLGRRILFAGHQPFWINLDEDTGSQGFVNGIKQILGHIQCGVGADLNAAFLFLEAHGVDQGLYIILGNDSVAGSNFFNICTILGQARYYHEWE